jgi:putative transposase
MSQSPDPHRRAPLPAGIIARAVWLYHVFSLSLRDNQLLLSERVLLSYSSCPVQAWPPRS